MRRATLGVRSVDCKTCRSLVRLIPARASPAHPGWHFRGTAMLYDTLASTLFDELCRIPLIDPHSHIDPFAPTARGLDDLLGYHYYTELAHSAGMGHAPLGRDVDA